MKIAKRAEQKNVILNKDFYTVDQLVEMSHNREVVAFGQLGEYFYDIPAREMEEMCLRIFTSDLVEIKVKLLDGFYQAVAVGKNGTEYIVEL